MGCSGDEDDDLVINIENGDHDDYDDNDDDDDDDDNHNVLD